MGRHLGSVPDETVYGTDSRFGAGSGPHRRRRRVPHLRGHRDAQREAGMAHADRAEFQWPVSNMGTKNITITSYYGGVDYRQTGAKLVLDSTKYGMNWRIKAPTTWEYLNIES